MIWKSKDYDLTPHLLVDGDNVVASTGGVFRGRTERVTVAQFLVAVAVGTATGVATSAAFGSWGVAVIPLASSTTRPTDIGAFENMTVASAREANLRAGKPGLVVLDGKTGTELHKYAGKDFVSGTGAGSKGVYYADSESVFLCEPPTWQPRVVGGAAGAGGETLWLFSPAGEGEAMILSIPNKASPILRRVTLDSRDVTWAADPFDVLKLPLMKRKGWSALAGDNMRDPDNLRNAGAPDLVAAGGGLLFVNQKNTVLAIDAATGGIRWNVDVGDGKWSLYPSHRALVWYAPKTHEINFRRFQDTP